MPQVLDGRKVWTHIKTHAHLGQNEAHGHKFGMDHSSQATNVPGSKAGQYLQFKMPYMWIMVIKSICHRRAK
jgi:hypothetical protein